MPPERLGAHGEVGPIQITPGPVTDLRRWKTLPGGWDKYAAANLTAGALYYVELMSQYGVPESEAAAAYNGGKHGTKSRAAQAYQANFDKKKSAFDALLDCIK
jgi:hypothetical protein